MRRFALFLAVCTAAILTVAPSASSLPSDAATQNAAGPRIVAIGDVHGGLQNFTAILKRAGLIDDQQRWAGGKTTFVQTGDLCDRGAGMKAVLDLMMALEEQAKSAGGRVHALLGNHEVMNMVGETRDGSAEIFASFGGEDATREAFGPRGRYGKWLRSKGVITEVDDTVFMHAGVDPTFSDESLNAINQRVRREIAEWDEGLKYLVDQKLVSASPRFLDAVEAARREQERLLSNANRNEPDVQRTAAQLSPLANVGSSALFAPNGPLWFRGFATWPDDEGDAKIAAILKKFKANRFVTGHTPQADGRINERFAGKLFLIDTGMLGAPFFPKGQPSALEITTGGAKPLYLN
ncbi:MAG TPA: metallophosphoesterase [Vicinamibacterales bacterium]|nr:metallophosphoesterase [Vicinamibacterales bacterium]